jgi:multidrug efflux pump
VETLSSLVGVDAANNTMLHTGRMLVNLKSARGSLEPVMDRLRRAARRWPACVHACSRCRT